MMMKYTNALFITHHEISEDFGQVDMSMINQSDDDRVFFNLAECSGSLNVIKTIKGIALAKEFDNYILCIDRFKGLQWTDYFIKEIFHTQMMKLHVYLPPMRSHGFAELLLKHSFFKGVQIILSDEKDLNMVRKYVGRDSIHVV